SLLIARLAQQLQAAGWAVPVRALLSDCNTARKVASCPRAPARAANKTDESTSSEASSRAAHGAGAEVLSIAYFTALQILFTLLLSSPALLALGVGATLLDFSAFFATAGVWEFVAAGGCVYLLGMLAPFAALLWAMAIKLLLGADIYRNGVRPGAYPKWSRMHLRIWCIGRLESLVLGTLSAMYRSPPLMAFLLRQLGAEVGANLQCAHDADLSGPLDLLSIGDDVAV